MASTSIQHATNRYAADPFDGLSIVELEPLFAIFQRRSGLTHIVDGLVPLILEPLGKEPLSARELMDQLAQRFELDAEDDAEATILARLHALEESGLVWRV